MRISVAEAQEQLTELFRRAGAGDEVVLTQVGHPDIRLVPEPVKLDKESRLKLIRELQKSAAKRVLPGPDAARSQDFLYDEFGIPK